MGVKGQAHIPASQPKKTLTPDSHPPHPILLPRSLPAQVTASLQRPPPLMPALTQRSCLSSCPSAPFATNAAGHSSLWGFRGAPSFWVHRPQLSLCRARIASVCTVKQRHSCRTVLIPRSKARRPHHHSWFSLPQQQQSFSDCIFETIMRV